MGVQYSRLQDEAGNTLSGPKKLNPMETLIKFLDSMEDLVIAQVWRVRRYLAPRPKERRRVARTHLPPRDEKVGDGEHAKPA